MKTFELKPKRIEAKQFLGTRESAKEISDWIKADDSAGYSSAELREMVVKGGFDDILTPDASASSVLTIILKERASLYIEGGDWVVRYVETDTYTVMSHERVTQNYREV